MGGKPKAKPKRKMTQGEQSERFKETARKLEADESGEHFERGLEKLLKPATPIRPPEED